MHIVKKYICTGMVKKMHYDCTRAFVYLPGTWEWYTNAIYGQCAVFCWNGIVDPLGNELEG